MALFAARIDRQRKWRISAGSTGDESQRFRRDRLHQCTSRIEPYELTDEQWVKLEPLLPPQKPKTGRPNDDHRTIMNGMLWVLNSGAPWRDLPWRYGPVGTVS